MNATVDWNSLKNAHGGARRVPALVKALARGKSEEDMAVAAYALRRGLYFDGAVAPSAAPTVSLLLEVVGAAHGAHLAAQLIGDALTAGHLRCLAAPRAPIGGPIGDVHEAALEGGETLLSAVDHHDARVRAAGAFALAWLPELGESSRRALRRRLAIETDDDALLSEALALALLCRDARSSEDERTFQRLREAVAPGARAAAALAGLVLGDQTVEGFAELAARLAAPVSSPFGYGALDQAMLAIAKGVDCSRELAVGMLRALDGTTSVAVWSAAARLALDLGKFKESWQIWDVALPEELSETQRAIALELTRRSGIEGLGWGIPRSVRDRRRWLGVAAPGALEKIIAVSTPSGERKWPVWKVWRVLDTRPGVVDFPMPIVDALSVDELVEAYGEVCAGAYHIGANRCDPPLKPVLDALPYVTEKAVAWAHGFCSEMREMLAANALPELGSSRAIRGTAAVFLLLLTRGEPIPRDLERFLPVSGLDSAPARAILERSGPNAEEVLWAWMSEHPFGHLLAIPLLDCAPSKRIAERMVEALRRARNLPDATAEELWAKIRAVAARVPAVAEALR